MNNCGDKYQTCRPATITHPHPETPVTAQQGCLRQDSSDWITTFSDRGRRTYLSTSSPGHLRPAVERRGALSTPSRIQVSPVAVNPSVHNQTLDSRLVERAGCHYAQSISDSSHLAGSAHEYHIGLTHLDFLRLFFNGDRYMVAPIPVGFHRWLGSPSRLLSRS
jgi:hypothetical protein